MKRKRAPEGAKYVVPSAYAKKRKISARGNIASTDELRRQRKNTREKERRHEVNEWFETLMNLLGLRCQSDKARILQKAIEMIQMLNRRLDLCKVSLAKMKHENETLREFSKQYVYKLAKPVAEVLRKNNGMTMSETKAQLRKSVEEEHLKLQKEYIASVKPCGKFQKKMQ